MTQYEELKNDVRTLTEKVNSLIDRFSTYKYLNEELNAIAPDAFVALQAAVEKGVVAYGDNGFEPGLTKDTIRMLIYQYRLGLFR